MAYKLYAALTLVFLAAGAYATVTMSPILGFMILFIGVMNLLIAWTEYNKRR